MRNVRIGIMTTLWKRHDLERIVLDYYSNLEVEGVTFCLAAAGSEGWKSETLARTNGWEYVETPNAPLGQKHNLALQAVCRLRPDCIVIIGSDDLVSASYFELVRDAYRKGFDAIKLDGCYFYDVETDRLRYFHKIAMGAGRMISYEVCRQRHFKAWPDDRERYLDGSMHRQILQYTTPLYLQDQRDHGFYIVDIKTASGNMWNADDIEDFTSEERKITVDADEVFNRHFPGVLDRIRELKSQPIEA